MVLSGARSLHLSDARARRRHELWESRLKPIFSSIHVPPSSRQVRDSRSSLQGWLLPLQLCCPGRVSNRFSKRCIMILSGCGLACGLNEHILNPRNSPEPSRCFSPCAVSRSWLLPQPSPAPKGQVCSMMGLEVLSPFPPLSLSFRQPPCLFHFCPFSHWPESRRPLFPPKAVGLSGPLKSGIRSALSPSREAAVVGGGGARAWLD